MSILDTIITHKHQEVATAKKLLPISELKELTDYSRKTFSLKDRLALSPGIIAEYKRKSPSKGIINGTASVQETVAAYEKYGARAVSVLTDHEFFGGHIADLKMARQTVQIPILRKDFMIDEYQFHEAKAHGADVILLIAACLSPAQVDEFTALSHELGLEVLLEIHIEEELKHYNDKVDFVGINNRNLKDFVVDLQHSVNLKNLLPAGAITVAESGIYSTDDYSFLERHGFQGFLMGEYFMKNADPGLAFQQFIQNVSHEN